MSTLLKVNHESRNETIKAQQVVFKTGKNKDILIYANLPIDTIWCNWRSSTFLPYADEMWLPEIPGLKLRSLAINIGTWMEFDNKAVLHLLDLAQRLSIEEITLVLGEYPSLRGAWDLELVAPKTNPSQWNSLLRYCLMSEDEATKWEDVTDQLVEKLKFIMRGFRVERTQMLQRKLKPISHEFD